LELLNPATQDLVARCNALEQKLTIVKKEWDTHLQQEAATARENLETLEQEISMKRAALHELVFILHRKDNSC